MRTSASLPPSAPPEGLRVGYLLSSSLLESSDLLPSNQGRSTLVHSLIYHLDLLDLRHLAAADDDDQRGSASPEPNDASPPTKRRKTSARKSEYRRLLRHLGADVGGEREMDEAGRLENRAVVYEPRRATRQELEVYHDKAFVRRLLDGEQEQAEEVAPKDGTDSDSNDEERPRPLRPPSPSNRDATEQRAQPRTKNQFGLVDDCPPFEGLKDHVELVAGASIRAAELLATGEVDVAIAWDGGRHHAKKDAASGFCYVNDAVLAILALRKLRKRRVPVVEQCLAPNGGADGTETATTAPKTPPGPKRYKTVSTRMDRILYLDLDLHWGDGVEEAFYTSSSVLTLSIHHYAPGFFPCYHAAPSAASSAANGDAQVAAASTKHGAPGSLECTGGPSGSAAASKALCLPLLPGANGDSLRRVLKANVESIVETFDPECIVVQFGLDGLAGDPMATWNLDALSILHALSLILSWTRPRAGSDTATSPERKLLLLGGGGYDNANTAKVWSLITAFVLGRFHQDSDRDRRDGEVGEGRETARGNTVDLNTAIPESCPSWPRFDGGSLDVKAGEMVDTNDEAHFDKVDVVFQRHAATLAAQRSSTNKTA
ncbi:uncharacterized protein PFL1_03946 [Pseudozyma flocculosa PF-1]|uniref:histone deacetylase n=1 Tax=Pseudozyma flocculosa PF-1 TaxID=1277687 RepID=A0A061H7N3_9BASI|nr:uncharacterized protein PFL1_03946 [Pseudozyma flocculosa PF-1]EPQ28643.1 hypothetical protein PFL1_03946 [Pseudozyma flocculosa PF-1]